MGGLVHLPLFLAPVHEFLASHVIDREPQLGGLRAPTVRGFRRAGVNGVDTPANRPVRAEAKSIGGEGGGVARRLSHRLSLRLS